LTGHTGRISVGGLDTRTVDPRELRRWVAVAPQEPSLFEGTVLENIALGDSAPDRSRAFEALRLSLATAFVESLPDGIDARLGQNGYGLSLGQKQRLAIARALYRGPRILILDESTSGLDVELETKLLSALVPALKGRTVLIISHRASALKHCGRVF